MAAAARLDSWSGSGATQEPQARLRRSIVDRSRRVMSRRVGAPRSEVEGHAEAIKRVGLDG
ncbi:hypothetical protein AQI96_15430 [Streptomyces canus]|nr:hypothetical protein AQI96_15430 [Streptomyces canus]